MSQISKFLRARFSAEGILGLHLTAGALILIAATLLFGAIAEDVVHREPLTVTDSKLSNLLHSHSSVPITAALLLITNLHSTIPITLISIVLVAYFLRCHLKYWALAFALSIGGGMLLNLLLKSIFHRARPQFEDPIVTLTSYGFPSGHTMMATTLYGFLCVFAISRTRSWAARTLIVVSATFMILLVGSSRIYLGAHYLSDVLAAIAEGLAWLALCLTGVYTMRRWKERN